MAEQQHLTIRHRYELLREPVIPYIAGLPFIVQLVISPILPILWCVDLLLRWAATIVDTAIGDRGYIMIGSVIAAYLAVYGLVDAKHQREENQATLERSTFITLVSANAASFIVAMKRFGPVQMIEATEEPSLFKPWQWGNQIRPNQTFLWQWALSQLALCEAWSCNVHPEWRLDLTNADLSEAHLEMADFHNANFSGAYLYGTHLINADLSGANLEKAHFLEQGLSPPILGTRPVDLRFARYSEKTKFPKRFDPLGAGMILVDENGNRVPRQPEK